VSAVVVGAVSAVVVVGALPATFVKVNGQINGFALASEIPISFVI
jgi:hypothetical protein